MPLHMAAYNDSPGINIRSLLSPRKKVKSLCFFFNCAPRHEDVKEEWRYSSMHFCPRYSMEVSGQLHTPTALPPVEETPVSIG